MSPRTVVASNGVVGRRVGRAGSLARQWRATRSRDVGSVAGGLRESGQVQLQRLQQALVGMRHRVARLQPDRKPQQVGQAAKVAQVGARALTCNGSERRPRVVLLCYACVPGAGSEEGVGWTWAAAAAEVADVTLFTTPFAAPYVHKAARALGLPIEITAVEPARFLRWTATRRWGGYLYHVLWQVAATRALRRHEARNEVDVVHHVTWASDSAASALRASSAPVRIWGPVGGSTHMAPELFRYLSPRARFDEVVRDVVNGAIRRLGGDRVARHATLILALNHDVEARFVRHGTPIVVEPNCALELDELVAGRPTPAPPAGALRTALFVGRLQGWKGPLLAVDTMVHAPDWRLIVYGDGDQRDHMLARADKLGVGDRVEVRGRVARADVLNAFREADALLFPSFHDSAPWAVGEASAVGCPVVCLDVGGPRLLAGRNAHVVAVTPGADLAERLGRQLRELDGRGEPDDRWRGDRLPERLLGWYRGSTAAAATPAEALPTTGEVFVATA